MITTVKRVGQIWSHLGPGWLMFRVAYAARVRLGLLQRATPPRSWAASPPGLLITDATAADPAVYLERWRRAAPAFLFDPASLPDRSLFAAWDAVGEVPAAEVEELRRGELRFFGGGRLQVGLPPAWHRNHVLGVEAPSGSHWSRIGDFGHGDIKLIWEPSRFAFAFALARAYARDGDDSHAELFWSLLENWRANNSPHQGPNWKCGQETSLRLLAWSFAAYAFLHSPATTPARAVMLAELVAVSAERVSVNIGYALSQRNNHGVSEALGLFTAGALFPQLRGAAAWETRGRALLERLARELIYEDGGFAQHSVNYQRVAIHDYLWAIAVARRQGRPLSEALRRRVGRAASLLYQLQDPETGRLPRYGHDDGALVLPLTGLPYDDYRPVLQAAAFLTCERRWYPPGPWDEEVIWLGGPEALAAPLAPPARTDLRAEEAGLFTVRGKDSSVFLHCGGFRDRPGHADLLHLDLWWRGQNIAHDPGTYSYNAPEPWDTTMGETSRHNTVTVDGLSQMDRAGRFLWLPWARGVAEEARYSPAGLLACWEGSHDGYARLAAPVNHRRAVLRIAEGAWLVVDRLESKGEHSYTLHWHLPDVPHTLGREGGASLELRTQAGLYYLRCGAIGRAGEASLERAAPDGRRGWEAPRYSQREPALSLNLAAHAAGLTFWTVLAPEPCEVLSGPEALVIRGGAWQAIVTLPSGPGPLIASAVLGGTEEDIL